MNAQGWGPFSEELQLVAARRPDQITPVITSNEYDQIRITWSEPDYNGGSPLLGYRVKVRTQDGSFVEETTHCNGDAQDTRANLFCEIPMPVLRVEPYNLELGN